MYFQVLLVCLWSFFAASEVITVEYKSNFNAAACECEGTNNTGSAGINYICTDQRLGPAKLPTMFPLLSFISNYNRFGGEEPGAFIKHWWNETIVDWDYPPEGGFQLDLQGKPISGNMTLLPGTLVDRFGPEYGRYISAADAPFAQRALPPSALNTLPDAPQYPYGYHVYNVTKSFNVLGGPIRPWFGQPGLGTQFFTGGAGNVISLINEGFLKRVNMTEIVPGAGGEGQCG
ncbi:MAG: hypothetical protein Q9219_007185 [cf. Caloplaca sp. 3 TL-2023]